MSTCLIDLTPLTLNRIGGNGTLTAFYLNDNLVGNISVSGSTVSYNAFTGSHYAWMDNSQQVARGTLMRMTGENRNQDDEGNDGEPLYGVTATTIANDAACLGGYFGRDSIAQSETETFEPHLVAAVGNGDLWVVDDGRGDIAPGDRLISSDVRGCAMLDNPQRFPVGNIAGRAAQRVEWAGVVRGDDGIRRARISVLFEPSIRGGGGDLSRVVDRQQREIDELQNELATLRGMMESMARE